MQAVIEPRIHIRWAKPEEHRACRMLLPRAFGGKVAPMLFAAVLGEPPQVVGAAALLPWPQGTPRGFKLALRVAKPFRGRGAGKALVNAAIDEARRHGMKALYAPETVDPRSDEAAGWRAMGFDKRLNLAQFECPPRPLLDLYKPTADRMRERGWVPKEARIVPLKDAPHLEVTKLYLKFLGGVPEVVFQQMRSEGSTAFHPTGSYALLLSAEVAGAMLCRYPEPDVSLVEGVVIREDLRLGWANVVLKVHALERAMRDGTRLIRFKAYDMHQDTRKMASLAGARLINTNVLPYREI